MIKPFEWMLALRYLRARRQEGFISVIAAFSLTGIALGVGTLIVVMAVMNGFRSELLGRVLGVNGHVTAYGVHGNIPDYDDLTEALKKEAGVRHAMPLVQGQVMAANRGVAQGVMVTGIRMEDLPHKPQVYEHIVEGDVKAFGRGEGIMIGQRLAQKMELRIGDNLTLISPEGRATIAGLMPRVKAYPVVAFFNIGMFEYDTGLVFMPFEEAQTYFKLIRGKREAASAIEILVENVNSAEVVARRLRGSYKENLYFNDWKQLNSHFFNALQVERNVMFLILTLIILVAAFNIISSLIMLVKDKGRDIAILRTMGASRGAILRVFFICGASIGVVGTLAGVALGLGFALNIDNIKVWLEGLTGTELFAAEIYFLSHLPAEVDYREVMKVAGMALGLSFLATWYPAYKAARLDPAEALRYE